MKPKQTLLFVVLLYGVSLAREAQAFYNPSTGRWLSRDPIHENGGLNLYEFTINNPESFYDYLGEDTVSDDLITLNAAVKRWRPRGWDFAADVLQLFIGNSKGNLNVYRHHNKVKNDMGWRLAFWKHLTEVALSANGTFGDPLLEKIPEGGNMADPKTLKQLFDYRFGSRSDAFSENNELFYALYGSHYDYYGKYTCLGLSMWSINVKVALWDVETFPYHLGQEMFGPYEAASDLEHNHGWYGDSRPYAIWEDHFSSWAPF